MTSNDVNIEKALFLHEMLEKCEIVCSYICARVNGCPSASHADYPKMQCGPLARFVAS